MAPYIHADEVGTGNNIILLYQLLMDIIKKTPLLLIKNL